MNIPGPLQNMYLRNYCNNNNINFSLPIEEYIFDGCYIELYGALDRSSSYTPVPGGVGPMTINTLILQTIEAAEKN